MTAAEAITAFTALFVVIDPIGLAPIFVAMTAGMSPRRRRAIGIRACLIGAGILVAFALLGDSILTFIGISMPAFRIAGGMLLFLTALEMLFEKRQPKREGRAEEPTTDPSVFPLALPLIAGPGAIATMILLTDQASAIGSAQAIGVMLVVIAVVFGFFLMATPLERLLGPTGTNVTTRLLGMLLAALSVQFVLDGLLDLPGW